MGHTKGNWKWVGLKLKNDNNKIVHTEPFFSTTDSINEAKANRALIAAAPELLEALKEMLEQFPQRGVILDKREQKAVDKANEAINKAQS